MAKKRKKTPVEEGAPDASLEQLQQVLTAKTPKAAGGGAEKAAAPAKSHNGAKLTMDLLENATQSLVQRMGWFRDVRLRRVAEGFMKSHQLYQKASARYENGEDFAKPKHADLELYEKECKAHVIELTSRLKVTPMNAKRDINARAAGPGASVLGKVKAKVAEMKERAAELKKKPQSVIKSHGKKKRGALAKGKKPEAAQAAGAGQDADDDI
eukprot:TRINITY_DN8285_c0_g1_i1.p1 TRINITY_DN8285_c0_g1~~TRINITY_DN8285_c0_g1_i1.p1  ORF type:complete len:212 (-),score=94.01 TRINITY_DN8285_c0_g1_i1:202-837(-)